MRQTTNYSQSRVFTMARVYVGNLPIDIRERELDDLFYKYGRIREIDLKQPARPPAFAFIAFDDVRGTKQYRILPSQFFLRILNPRKLDFKMYISFSMINVNVDAEDAVRGRHGYNFDGQRLRCELAKGDRGGGRGGAFKNYLKYYCVDFLDPLQ